MRADARLITRRSFLLAAGLAFVSRFRLLATRFTSIEGSGLDWLMRWGCFYSGPRFAGAG